MERMIRDFQKPNDFSEYVTYRNAWRCELPNTYIMSLHGSQSAAQFIQFTVICYKKRGGTIWSEQLV